MTAFDNIKTNNWPAASNEFEDFLVLELPLNDQAALTESRRDIVAGSKVLFPKRTLTNVGVSSLAGGPAGAGNTINIAASEYSTSGTVANPGNLFDGDTSTSVSSSDGSRVYWTPASNISVTKFEVYFSSQYSGYKIGVEVTGGSSQIITKSNPGNSPGWVEFTSIAGDTIGPSNQIMFRSYRSNDTDPGVLGINAVRVNDKIVTTAALVISKKHYDNNARFTAATQPGSGNRISVDNFSDLSMGSNESWCFEAWINPTQVSDSTLFGLGNTGFAYRIIGGSPYLYVGGTGAILNTGTISTNTWTHVAVSRDGNTLRSYINGTQVGSDTTNTASWDVTSGTGAGVFIGAGNLTNVSPPNYHFDGSIQDLRFYKGVAKYTSNFTPPAAILG